MKNIIEVSHFTKNYGNFRAVDDVSFNVPEGAIFAFLGPNGAGKSTTINTLCTILDKTSGTMKINGHDVAKEKDSVRQDIGIVFQENTLDARLSVEENLKFHCRFYKVPQSEVSARIDFVLDLVDLKAWRKSAVGGLSGGMKRRVEIARGLIHYPKVLFLDEPTAGLDPQTRANVWEYIYKLQKQKNITIFLTTHYMDEAEICSSVAIIDHGRIAAFDTPSHLKDQFSTSVMHIKAIDYEKITNYLQDRKLKYELNKDALKVYAKNTRSSLDMLAACKEEITDFEVSKGSLNDVFLNVTGREIRE